MPSGKTHDAITLLAAGPVFAAAWSFLGVYPAITAAIAFLIGGLIFGPDLDTRSIQYRRWSIFSFLWIPYRKFFNHRSRWSHGLIFGAFFRVVYFAGVVTLFLYGAAAVFSIYSGKKIPAPAKFIDFWREAGILANSYSSENLLLIIFAGLWLGAASHTLTDISISYIKTGRVKGLL